MTKSPLLLSGAVAHTSQSVRQAMLDQLDPASREFAALEARLRRRLLDSTGINPGDYLAHWTGDSGSQAIQAAFRACLRPGQRILIPANGPLARRAAAAARALGHEVLEFACPEDSALPAAEIASKAESSGPVQAILVAHCEPSTGVLNPIATWGRIASNLGARFIVDASMTFGAYPLDIAAFGIDALAACSGRGLESAPGLGLLLASCCTEAQCCAPAQEEQFCEAPPIPLLLALEQALIELEQEGGVEGRAARYRDNHFTLVSGMAELGFEPVVRAEFRSHLLTRFRALPGAPQDLPALAASCGYRIAAGPTVASMGRIYPSSIEEFIAALKLAAHAPQPAA